MDREPLFDALDGLFAYDTGCASSGIHDELLRDRVKTYLQGLEAKLRHAVIAEFAIENYLGPQALAKGYGPEDACQFLQWCDNKMGILL